MLNKTFVCLQGFAPLHRHLMTIAGHAATTNRVLVGGSSEESSRLRHGAVCLMSPLTVWRLPGEE